MWRLAQVLLGHDECCVPEWVAVKDGSSAALSLSDVDRADRRLTVGGPGPRDAGSKILRLSDSPCPGWPWISGDRSADGRVKAPHSSGCHIHLPVPTRFPEGRQEMGPKKELEPLFDQLELAVDSFLGAQWLWLRMERAPWSRGRRPSLASLIDRRRDPKMTTKNSGYSATFFRRKVLSGSVPQ